MLLESTRHQSPAVSFREALLRGLAPDGGLYLPAGWPSVTFGDLRAWMTLPFRELATRLAGRLLADEFPTEVIERLVADALDFPVPTVAVEPGRSVLELFHGPTLAFKDFGARFLARFFGHLLAQEDREATILVATSGDTGSAVAQGFYRVPRVRVVVLYPKGKVSPFQESQMATLGENVTAVRVSGTFDDCQRLVKSAFLDPGLASLNLSSANSINIGRLLPQSFYYVASYLAIASEIGEQVIFSVPTGNLGNLTAGIIAVRLGLPVARFVAGTNVNRVLPDYLDTGTYRARPSIATLSNAMDVGDPSNFARLLELYGGSLDRVRQALYSTSIDEDETRATIRRVYERTGYVLDPHTAVGWAAADRFFAESPTSPPSLGEASHDRQAGSAPSARGKRASAGRPEIITLATAHPAKFGGAIRETLGFTPSLPPQYADWKDRPLLAIDLEQSEYTSFRDLLVSRC
jgi:threonine synthase